MRAFQPFGMIFMDQTLVSRDQLGHNPQLRMQLLVGEAVYWFGEDNV